LPAQRYIPQKTGAIMDPPAPVFLSLSPYRTNPFVVVVVGILDVQTYASGAFS
jgi:hypothetical protein